MEQMDLAWIIFGGLKATGVEPADYPPINAWMARRVIAGMTPTYLPEQQHQVCQHSIASHSAQTILCIHLSKTSGHGRTEVKLSQSQSAKFTQSGDSVC